MGFFSGGKHFPQTIFWFDEPMNEFNDLIIDEFIVG